MTITQFQYYTCYYHTNKAAAVIATVHEPAKQQVQQINPVSTENFLKDVCSFMVGVFQFCQSILVNNHVPREGI